MLWCVVGVYRVVDGGVYGVELGRVVGVDDDGRWLLEKGWICLF